MKKGKMVLLGEGYNWPSDYESGRYRGVTLGCCPPSECDHDVTKPISGKLYGQRIRLWAEVLQEKKR